MNIFHPCDFFAISPCIDQLTSDLATCVAAVAIDEYCDNDDDEDHVDHDNDDDGGGTTANHKVIYSSNPP